MGASSVLIELQYLPCLEYVACLLKYDTVYLEQHEFYEKQSYRNRFCILTANKVAILSVPVVKGNHKQRITDVQIDYSQNWVKDHWRTIASAYGKSPFFDHFAPYLEQIFAKQHRFLFDLNIELLTKCLNLLDAGIKINFTSTYQKYAENGQIDLRSAIHPKKDFTQNHEYQPIPYLQNFGSNFVPNLSILDALFCEGKQALHIIRQSIVA